MDGSRRFTIPLVQNSISFWKMVWLFIICSVVGFVAETLYGYATMGVLENRQGVIYGPFSQVYGFGAVVLVMSLSPFARRSNLLLFLGGAVLGGIYEFSASWLQEILFGTVSWDYSYQKYSFDGRTSVFYIFFWAVLGFVLIKFTYPRFSELVERVPKRTRRVITWVIIMGMSFNMLISGLAIARWADRVYGIEARNAYEVFIDRHYPDEVMWKVYPNMRFPGLKKERELE